MATNSPILPISHPANVVAPIEHELYLRKGGYWKGFLRVRGQLLTCPRETLHCQLGTPQVDTGVTGINPRCVTVAVGETDRSYIGASEFHQYFLQTASHPALFYPCCCHIYLFRSSTVPPALYLKWPLLEAIWQQQNYIPLL